MIIWRRLLLCNNKLKYLQVKLLTFLIVHINFDKVIIWNDLDRGIYGAGAAIKILWYNSTLT